MRLVSPCQPSLITVTSMLTMSPSFSTLPSLGMPWQMTLLTDVQIGLGVAAVADIGRDGVLHVDDVVVADAVQFRRGRARLHMRGHHLQHFGGQAAGNAHLLDFFGGLGGECHPGIIVDLAWFLNARVRCDLPACEGRSGRVCIRIGLMHPEDTLYMRELHICDV